MKPSTFIPFGLGLANAVGATRLAMAGRRSDAIEPSDLQRRTAIGGELNVTSGSNIQYIINCTLGGDPISIMIDTGSSDFVTSKNIKNATDQHYNESISYASGSAVGEIHSSTFHFADYVIPDQYYIYASASDAFGSLDGLVGLGPSAGSAVRQGGNSSQANPPIDRIFLMDNSTDNYITVLLSRSDDPDEPYPGELTVSEVIPEHAAILNQTKLEIAQVPQELQHWQVYLDQDGIKGPDGNRISIKSNVTNSTHPNNASVVFDTGFTLPQVPAYIAEAFYANSTGASLQNISGLGNVWTLPCDTELSASFYFAGVEFPIHPLDLVFDSFGTQSENGTDYCVGGFQPFSFDQEEVGIVPYDMILGMAFLRNAYMLINFGEYVNVDTPKDGAAYIQLLPLTTNLTEADADFQKERTEQDEDGDSLMDKTNNEISNLWDDITGHKGNLSNAAVGGIIAGIAVVALAVVGGLIWCCTRRRRNAKAAAAGSYAQWMPGHGNSYRGIDEPTPAGADDMRIHSGAQPGSQQQYSTAWDYHH